MRTVEKEVPRALRIGPWVSRSAWVAGDSQPTYFWEQIVSHQSKTGI